MQRTLASHRATVAALRRGEGLALLQPCRCMTGLAATQRRLASAEAAGRFGTRSAATHPDFDPAIAAVLASQGEQAMEPMTRELLEGLTHGDRVALARAVTLSACPASASCGCVGGPRPNPSTPDSAAAACVLRATSARPLYELQSSPPGKTTGGRQSCSWTRCWSAAAAPPWRTAITTCPPSGSASRGRPARERAP
jgi:hypothetical protein